MRIDQPDRDDGRAGDNDTPDTPDTNEARDADAAGGCGAARLERAVPAASAGEHEAYRARVDAVFRAHATDPACNRVREIERGTVTPATKRIEAQEPERRLAGLEYRAAVDATYRAYDQTATPETADQTTDNARFLHADADPLRALGPASETHPAELEAAMEMLDGAGVEVDLRRGTMSYSPSAMSGEPGRIILDPEASYGAMLHEMSHFSDDEAAGYPGLRYWLEDPVVTAAGESRAYQVEIDYANSIGEAGIASKLEQLRADRISQLLDEANE